MSKPAALTNWNVRISAGLIMALAGQHMATAQTLNKAPGTEPGQDIVPPSPAPTQAITPPPVEHFFGTWGGLQPTLEAQGVNIQLDAITEFAGNISGGIRQGSTFASQIGMQADVNWQSLAGLTGLSTHIIAVQRSGSSDSHLFGDNLLPVQEIYGSGGDVGVHLVSAYAQETLFNIVSSYNIAPLMQAPSPGVVIRRSRQARRFSTVCWTPA